MVQLDAYFHGKPERRPDFGIWLPASKEYIYLELKQTGWGDYSSQYYYAKAIEDIEKLDAEIDPRNQRNGLIAVGFSDPKKRSELLLENSSSSKTATGQHGFVVGLLRATPPSIGGLESKVEVKKAEEPARNLEVSFQCLFILLPQKQMFCEGQIDRPLVPFVGKLALQTLEAPSGLRMESDNFAFRQFFPAIFPQ